MELSPVSSLFPLLSLSTMLRKIVPACLLPKTKTPEPELHGVAFERKSIYNTSFGNVTITWTHTGFMAPFVSAMVGFAELDPRGTSTSSLPADQTRPIGYQVFAFDVNPTHPDQLQGVKKFKVMKNDMSEPLCEASFAWDFSRARCAIPGSAQPSSCYYFAMAVDGQMHLLFGDKPEWAYALTDSQPGPDAVLSSREDRVNMKGTTYNTSVVFEGLEREISIKITRGALATMSVKIDRKKVVVVKNLVKTIHGDVKFDLASGHFTHITWDLHGWLLGHANVDDQKEEPVEEEKEDGLFQFTFIKQGVNTAGETCTGNYALAMHKEQGLTGRRRLVEEWVRSKEERINNGETFYFVVYLWKS